MKSPFNETYSQHLVNESIKSIIASPKTLLAAALMLGLVDVGYVIPKINEVQQKVEQSLQQKTPEQIQQIETTAIQQQNTPKVQSMIAKLKNSWKNYKPKPPTAAEMQAQGAPSAPKQLGAEFIDKVKQMIKGDEGRRNKLYKDTKGKWTIGYGHLIKDKAELKKYQKRTLSDKEINNLLDADVNEYNDDLKMTIINGFFRGDLSGSPATIKLINQGLYKQAAKEYLNHGDYIAASKPNAEDRGVAIRMYRNAQNIAKQATK
jgi:hypothetical protein